MRAIEVLRMMLLVGSMAAAHAAVAVEDMRADARTVDRTVVRAVYPQRLERIAMYPAARLASLSASDRVAQDLTASEVLQPDLFAMNRREALAPPAPAASHFARRGFTGDFSGGLDGNVLTDEQQRIIGVLQRHASNPRMRSAGDFWLMVLVGLMLIAYQLCRKHRFLRPQPFTI